MLLFPPHTVFRDIKTDQTIQFFPDTEGNKLIWKTPGADRFGTYQLLKDRLEISFNYAREETYLLIILQMEEDTITAFRLKDRLGRETDFLKVV
ncbi:hypothetical protein [Chitinophaga barathri]|uniref:Uncharacterized protein n=1 Tax=Chitinophaga barathri TaxID=1647451 RepID=A0A3N4M705_9BACT|nr:hypothetical protein [Chitinophaga barathri]RPD38988.1 hypothetical protein EG028_22890 [Chitinophaga barathri]